MLSFFKPESVEVEWNKTTLDDLGEVETRVTESIDVEVLVCPASTQDLAGERINGTEVVYTLHFPKTWSESLRGAFVWVRGEKYAVKGDPQPYTQENNPLPWNLSVEVVRVDG